MSAFIGHSAVESAFLDEVRANDAFLRAYIRRTPVIELPSDIPVGGGSTAARPSALWLKLEAQQVTGSFKVRGALTAAANIAPALRANGLVTVSSGNHAIATAWVARILECTAEIYVSSTADPHRIGLAREMGAIVRLSTDVAQAFTDAETVEKASGKVFLHPFEGPFTSLGNASLALELETQLPADVDVIVVAVGGGGLISGIAPTIKRLRPGALVIGVEPEGAPTLTRSLAAGVPLPLREISTIADSLAPPFTGPNTFSLVRDYVDEILLVSDDQIRDAMRVLLDELKLMIEPSGAAAFAAVGAHPHRFAGRKVCCVLCGSNIGIVPFADFIGRGAGWLPEPGREDRPG